MVEKKESIESHETLDYDVKYCNKSSKVTANPK